MSAPATVDGVPREALRVVLALAIREAGKPDAAHAGGPAMMERAISMVRAALDGEGKA